MPDEQDDGRVGLPADSVPASAHSSTGRPTTLRSGRFRFARLVGLVAFAVIAGLIHPRALAAVAVIATVLLLGLISPWLGVRGVRAHWTYPVRRGQVGRPLAVRVTLHSISPWPVFGLVVRGGWTDPDGPTQDPVTVAVPRVGAFGVREVVATVVPTHRGVYPTQPPTVASGFPFGLRQARRPARFSGQVIVWPEVIPLAAGGEAGGIEGGAVVRSPRVGDRGEFVGTRPYRAGEPLNRIHWKQSARHDRLIAVESRATARRAVLLVIETDPQIHTHFRGRDSLERTLSVGASLAAGLADTGIHVTLTFETGRVFSMQNRPQLAVALDAMARLNGGGVDQEELLNQLPARLARGLVPWVITTIAGWRRAGEVGRAGRRRFVVIDERDPRTVTGGGSGEPAWGSPAKAGGSSPARAPAHPPGLPRGVVLVPMDDPGHHGLQNVWKEVAGGLHGLV